MRGLASCGETRTRSSCAETWRRSSSSARVSFSNWTSCSFTEAKMLAVDSTSESSMKVRGGAGSGQGKEEGGGSQRKGAGGKRPPYFTLSGKGREERKEQRSEKTGASPIPEPKTPARGSLQCGKQATTKPRAPTSEHAGSTQLIALGQHPTRDR